MKFGENRTINQIHQTLVLPDFRLLRYTAITVHGNNSIVALFSTILVLHQESLVINV